MVCLSSLEHILHRISCYVFRVIVGCKIEHIDLLMLVQMHS